MIHLSEEEQLCTVFSSVVSLPRKEKEELWNDFRKALHWYSLHGVSFTDAMERIHPAKLGSFYNSDSSSWWPLDDAAKIYPLSMTDNRMAIFRLSVYMKEQIVPELLQMALNFTIKRFPYFASSVKKGFFWHYVDSLHCRYEVNKETIPPCSPINISNIGNASFRLLYYKNRISVEFFHILTDGTGGLVFLKTVTAEYLRLLGVSIPPDEQILDISSPSELKEERNDFPEFQTQGAATGFADKKVVQLRGKMAKISPAQILHFTFSCDQLKSVAQEKNVTVTALLLACMFVAAKKSSNRSDRNIQIQIPVNMRKFYNSSTCRNFSMFCAVRFPWGKVTTVDDIVANIARQLKENSSKENMQKLVNMTARMNKNIHYYPLFLKNPIAKVIYYFLGSGFKTVTLTNLGYVSIPDNMKLHIRSMDFILGASDVCKVSCALISAKDKTTLSITKNTLDPSFENALLKGIRNLGVEVAVSGSQKYEV